MNENTITTIPFVTLTTKYIHLRIIQRYTDPSSYVIKRSKLKPPSTVLKINFHFPVIQ